MPRRKYRSESLESLCAWRCDHVDARPLTTPPRNADSCMGSAPSADSHAAEDHG